MSVVGGRLRAERRVGCHDVEIECLASELQKSKEVTDDEVRLRSSGPWIYLGI